MNTVKNITMLGAGFAIGFIYGEITAPPRTERRKGRDPVKAKAVVPSLAYYYANDEAFRDEFDSGVLLPKASDERIAIIVAGLRMLDRLGKAEKSMTLDQVKFHLSQGKLS